MRSQGQRQQKRREVVESIRILNPLTRLVVGVKHASGVIHQHIDMAETLPNCLACVQNLLHLR